MMRTLRFIPLREWPEIVAVALVAAGVEVGVRTVPLPRLARLVGVPLDTGAHRARPAGLRGEPSARTRRQLRATRRVMRHWPYGDTCLRHALVLGQRLRRLSPSLRVGVAKVDGEVRAHAWLEVDGGVLDPIGGAATYRRMESIRPVNVA